MINPVFLRTFTTLAEVRSFTRAAEILRMTQPGVSQHLKALEDYFAIPLVTREGRFFELTEAGQRVYEYARAMFSEHERFRLSLTIDEPESGLCRFASPGSFGMKMYTLLLRINQQYPNLTIHFAYAANAVVLKDVLEERIDVGFVSCAVEEAGLAAEPFDEERLCLAVPLAMSTITWTGLKDLGFINHPDGFNHASRLLAQNFPSDYVGMDEFKIRGFSNQIISSILEPVALGLGFTALPEFAGAAFSGRDQIRMEPLKRPVIDQIYWVQKRGRPLPSRFTLLKEAYAKVVVEPKGPRKTADTPMSKTPNQTQGKKPSKKASP